jgi:rSAM/selenodomain-associated transferase 1
MSGNTRALIVFAKKPQAGKVKTRLSPPLSQQEAAGLYHCMLEDSLAMALSLRGIIPFIFFQDDAAAADYFAALAPGVFAIPQRGGDLGERMKNAFSELLSRGFSHVAIIGTDSPDLPPTYINEAFELLTREETDVVFGPAEDGGYYLLALKQVWEELFSGLPWSSDGLLAASIARAESLGLGIGLLPQWHDVDTAADLERPTLLAATSSAKKTREFLISGLQPDSRPLSDR